MKKLIIFDMDGVLLDSEQLYCHVNRDFFASLGFEIAPEEYMGFVGISANTMWDTIRTKFNLSQSIEELKELELERKYQALSASELLLTDGMREFLDELKAKGYLMAIASSSMRKNIELIVQKLGLNGYFHLIISGEEVTQGKPAPDIFLKASEYFGLRPQDCVVIEDSANGVKAAKAAGMYCIAYRNPGSGNQDLSLADVVIDKFDDAELAAILYADAV